MRKDLKAYLAATLLHRAQPLIESFILTLTLSIEEFGQWSWASALYLGVASIAHGGIPAAMLRYSAMHVAEGSPLLGYGLKWMLPWAASGSLILLLLSFSVPSPVRQLVWAHLPALPAFLVAEVVRTYLRGRYENAQLLRWQILSTSFALILLALTSAMWGVCGAAYMRLLQPLWLLLPTFHLLKEAYASSSHQHFPGFLRFGGHSLWGNWALEGIFFLPAWLIGWQSESPLSLAYWRWATLLPLNIRAIFSQIVIYFYPTWVRSALAPHLLYHKQRLLLWGTATAIAIGLLLLSLGWRIFPGEAYLPALPYYWGAIGIGLWWSTEPLLLPNLLSAKGNIKGYSTAYAVGLLTAIPFYVLARENLWLHLVGMGTAGITASLLSNHMMRHLRDTNP
ncbi:MAG: hypothetical protein RMJ66_04825 [Bacteroidia bacterium]|nr:hypothetical protein [Bacteroidia bacterium]MDW8134371.1 hypothetical protein [Bacteroidia bacterium]